MKDLQPYVCTYWNCPQAVQAFDDKEDWLNHEASHREKTWRCPDDAQEFTELASYMSHIASRHSDCAAQLLTPEILASHGRSSSLPDRPCPFCLTSFDKLRDMQLHVATHLERIAIFAFPKLTQDDNSELSVGSNKAIEQARDGQTPNSREGDFDDNEPR